MAGQCETSTGRRAQQWIGRSRVVIVLCWILLAATAATAQPNGGEVTETVATLSSRDLNGRDVANERVVTRNSRTSDGEDVVIEAYLPSIEAGRLVLSRRVHRVTRVTSDGSETVEETEARPLASQSEDMRVVKRSVTTVRRSGTDAYAIERREFERDMNGRFVLVRTETAHRAGR